jgi:hypothetical protein
MEVSVQEVIRKSQLLILLLLTILIQTGLPLTAEVYIENVQIIGDQFTWEIHFRPISGWTGGDSDDNSKLYAASFYFHYNSAALHDDPMFTYKAPWLKTNYLNMVGVVAGNVQITIGPIGHSQQVVEGTKYHMYTITMTIKDYDELAGLTWNQDDTGIENKSGDIADKNDLTFTGSGDVTLPVQLSSFSGIAQEGAVKLQWSTQSEIDNLGFNIYRRLQDEKIFQKINNSLIEGAGTSSQKQNYDFMDTHISQAGTYEYKLEQKDINGRSEWHGPIKVEMNENLVIPVQFVLDQNYPNPFNPATTIRYGLAMHSMVKLQIFNMRGELIDTLVNTQQPEGFHDVVWQARSSAGTRLPSGIYFCKLQTDYFTNTIKMILTK